MRTPRQGEKGREVMGEKTIWKTLFTIREMEQWRESVNDENLKSRINRIIVLMDDEDERVYYPDPCSEPHEWLIREAATKEINGAWFLEQLPTALVVELSDGALKTHKIDPFRKINEADLNDYNGDHPRKRKGIPLPEPLYKFYGYTKSPESLTEVIRARITPKEKEKFESVLPPGESVSDSIRKYVQSVIRGGKVN